jgi:hypothetical protein
MTKKTKKKSRKKAILLIVIIFVVIAAIGIYQNQVQSSPIAAQDYFQIIQAGVINADVKENNTLWIVYGINVQFKAVKGDAHEVVVQSWGGSEAAGIGTMLKDVPKGFDMTSKYGVAIRRQPEGFPVTIKITSLEASGSVKFYLSG